MNVWAFVAITLVVWAVTTIRSPGLRATLYSLPIPMSLAIVLVDADPPSGNQLLGVFLLVAFFSTVRTLSLRMSNVLAVAISTAGYLAVTVTIERLVQLPWTVAYVLAPLLWALGIALTNSLRPDAADRSTGASERVAPALLGSALATAVSFALGSSLGGFIVTFPYSGVAVALLWRDDRRAFCQKLARRSIGLYVFLGVYHEVSGLHSLGVSLAAAWAAFLLTLALAGTVSRLAWGRTPVPPG